MAKKTRLKNAAILTVTGLLLRGAGMFFRVYIAAEIGAAGMGLYQLIFTVYNLAITFATAGLSAVTTRTVAALDTKQSERYVMRVLMILSLITGVCAGTAQLFSANMVSKLWLKDMRAATPLIILAPSLPFMAVSAVLRGYFMAVRSVKPNAVAQMGEQAIRIALVSYLLMQNKNADIGTACCMVVIGNTISEAASWLFMVFCYKRNMRGVKSVGNQSGHIMAEAVKRILPISGGQYASSALHTVENVLVPQSLAAFCGSYDNALSQYGALRGMAMPVLFFPFSIIITLATLLLPDVTQAWIKNDTASMHTLLSRILSITIAAAVPAAAVFWMFSYDIGAVLYKNTDVGLFLRVVAPLTPLMYLESMVDGVLKGIDKQSATFRYTLAESAARIVLIWYFVPRYGISGFLAIMLAGNIFTSLMNLRCLLVTVKLRFELKKWLLKPVLSAGVSSVIVWFLFVYSPHSATMPILKVCTGSAALICIYFILMLLLSPKVAFSKYLLYNKTNIHNDNIGGNL